MCKHVDNKEAELLKKVAAGDQTAMKTLYLKYFFFAHSCAYRARHDPDLADDIVQTSFLHLFEALSNGTYDLNESVPFRNKLKNCIRAKLRHSHVLPTARISLHAEAEDNLMLEISDSRRSGEWTPEMVELLEDLNDCINLLPTHLASLIRMKYVEAMTISHIAQMWTDETGEQKTLDSIRTHHLSKAKKALLKCLRNKGHRSITE